MDPITLASFIGQTISVRLPDIGAHELHTVLLVGVEAGGIWIQHQKLMDEFLSSVGVATSPKDARFFLPFAAITFLAVGVPGPGLNEKAFGVE